MEAAAASHYGKRWDIMYDREPVYSTERWKDVASSGINGRKLSISTTGSISSSPLAWSDGVAMSDLSSSPSLLSVLPSATRDGNVDTVLYHDLVEMIPLVETFMDQKHISRSFRKRAPLIYTPAPPRDPLTAQKEAGHSSGGKKGHGQLLQEGSNAMVAQLQGQLEELELKLQEKESQLQAAENTAKQHAELLCLQTVMKELQGQILTKEREIEKTQKELLEAQREVNSLHSLLQRTEADVEVSNLNLAKVHEESQSLQCQVAAFLLWMESISACVDADPQMDGPQSSSKRTAASTRDGQENRNNTSCNEEDDQLEMSRRKYLASLIAVRHNPTDEMLFLVAELRGQLQASMLAHDKKTTPCYS